MTGSFLGAWGLFPLVLLLASLGCGLLVRRLAGGGLSPVLVCPVGFALVMVICAFTTSYGWLAPAAWPLVVIAALAGLALEPAARPRALRRLRLRLGGWVWPVLGALAGFAAVGGPVFLTGRVGWTGYARIVDIGFQMDFAQHVADAGRVAPPNGASSYNIVTTKLLGIGYPGGAQATLGVMANLVHVNVIWCYQAFLAFVAAMGALAIYATLGLFTRNGPLRALGAAVAVQPNILYGYALEAGIKELAAATMLVTVVGVAADGLPGPGHRRRALPLAVACSAAFGAFSLGIAPWLALILLGLFALSLARRAGHLEALQSWALFAVVLALISLPGLITAVKLATVAGSAIGGVVDLGLGNLAVPVSRWASAGVYLTGDYRYPLVHVTATHVFDVIIIALAVLGVLAGLVRRRWLVGVLGVTALVALYYFIQHSTAWIQLKAFTVTSVFALLLAFAGIAALHSNRRLVLKVAAWLAALAVAGAVLYGNAIIYHDTTLAPGNRYHDLAAIGARYAGQGPALDPTFDEYAEFLLRGVKATSLVDPANLTFQVRKDAPPPPGGQAFNWDLNELVLPYLESFPLIIEPTNPTSSRPPSNYDLVQQTRYFAVWRRDRPPAKVVQHLPLSNLPHERSAAYCRNVLARVRAAGPGVQIAYAQPSLLGVANPVTGVHPRYWPAAGPSTLFALGAGTDVMSFSLPRRARYSVSLGGSIGRSLTFYIDGRRFASLGYEERYPNQFLLLGHRTLSAGRHTLRVVRGNGTLHPGSGDPATDTIGRTVGAIAFNAEDSRTNRVYVAPASRTAQICAAPRGYEWMEILRPGGAPPDALPAQG